MYKQREIISNINLDFKRDSYTQEKYLDFKTRFIIESMMKKVITLQQDTIVIENYKDNIDNFVTACLSVTAGAILSKPVLICGQISKATKKAIALENPQVQFKRFFTNKESYGKCLFICADSFYNNFPIYSKINKKDEKKIHYYPLMDMLFEDIRQISSEFYQVYPKLLFGDARKKSKIYCKQDVPIDFELSCLTRRILSRTIVDKIEDELNFKEDLSTELSIICFPNAYLKPENIDYINKNEQASVLYLKDKKEDIISNVYDDKIIKTTNCPLMHYNVFYKREIYKNTYDNENWGNINKNMYQKFIVLTGNEEEEILKKEFTKHLFHYLPDIFKEEGNL